jgi:hypothetical protein
VRLQGLRSAQLSTTTTKIPSHYHRHHHPSSRASCPLILRLNSLPAVTATSLDGPINDAAATASIDVSYKLASTLFDHLARAVTRSPDTPDAWTRLLTTLQPLFSPPPKSASSPLALLHNLVPASLRRQDASPLAGALPAAATTLACVLLVVLAIVTSMASSSSSSPTASWASRFWGGRFSPFGRPSTTAKAAEVKEGDYSYITGEDIARGVADNPDRP